MKRADVPGLNYDTAATSTTLLPEELEIRRRVVWACYSESGLDAALNQQYPTRSSRCIKAGPSASATTGCMSRTGSLTGTKSRSCGRHSLSQAYIGTRARPPVPSAPSPRFAPCLSSWSGSSWTSMPTKARTIDLAGISTACLLFSTDGDLPCPRRLPMIRSRTRPSLLLTSSRFSRCIIGMTCSACS